MIYRKSLLAGLAAMLLASVLLVVVALVVRDFFPPVFAHAKEGFRFIEGPQAVFVSAPSWIALFEALTLTAGFVLRLRYLSKHR